MQSELAIEATQAGTERATTKALRVWRLVNDTCAELDRTQRQQRQVRRNVKARAHQKALDGIQLVPMILHVAVKIRPGYHDRLRPETVIGARNGRVEDEDRPIWQ